MSSEETEAASPPWGSHRTGRRDSGHLAGSPSARWSGTEPTISRMPRGGSRLWSTKEDGAYVHQHLNFISFGKVHGRKDKASNRTTGNPAVRHYRGASGNVAMVEMRSHLAIERARLVTLHLQQARRGSNPNNTPQPNRGRTPRRE